MSSSCCSFLDEFSFNEAFLIKSWNFGPVANLVWILLVSFAVIAFIGEQQYRWFAGNPTNRCCSTHIKGLTQYTLFIFIPKCYKVIGITLNFCMAILIFLLSSLANGQREVDEQKVFQQLR